MSKYEDLFLDGIRYLTERKPADVDKILGSPRKALPQLDAGFYSWPMWRRYPTWQQYNQQLAEEREAAAKAGRAAHPSAAAPVHRPAPPQSWRNCMEPGKKHPKGWKGPPGSRAPAGWVAVNKPRIKDV